MACGETPEFSTYRMASVGEFVEPLPGRSSIRRVVGEEPSGERDCHTEECPRLE